MGQWAKNIWRVHNGNMKEIKDHRDQKKAHRDNRATSRSQLRRMKLTSEEKRELEARISGKYDHRSEKKKRRK